MRGQLPQQSLDLVYASVFGGDEPGSAVSDNRGPSPPADDNSSVALSDNEIIELACKKPRTGDKFRSLWDGQWNDHYNSASEADSSVVFTLAYYTKDAAQIDRIFRQSKLMRAKWDQKHGSETYGATTISKALSNQNTYFLNLQNGTLDMSTWGFRDQRQTDSITQLANVAFDPRAKCPKWRAFIDLIFGSDDEANHQLSPCIKYGST